LFYVGDPGEAMDWLVPLGKVPTGVSNAFCPNNQLASINKICTQSQHFIDTLFFGDTP
jgi:hypothetical protein